MLFRSLGSKAVMYDISTILRRLTDDAFYLDIPVSCHTYLPSSPLIMILPRTCVIVSRVHYDFGENTSSSSGAARHTSSIVSFPVVMKQMVQHFAPPVHYPASTLMWMRSLLVMILEGTMYIITGAYNHILTVFSRCAYVLTRSIDGNFHQYLKKRPKISKDDDLLRGAYFPDNKEYDEYISGGGNTEEVSRVSLFI